MSKEYVVSAKRNGVRVYRTDLGDWTTSMGEAWVVSRATAEHLIDVHTYRREVSNLRIVSL